MNVRKIAQSAMKQLGVLAAGENAEAGELADAIDSLQSLLAQWATDRLHVYKAALIDIPLQGHGVYVVKQQDDCTCFISCCDENLGEPIVAQISHISERAWLDDQQIQLVRDVNNTADHFYNSLGRNPVSYQVGAKEWLFYVRECAAKNLKIKVYTLPFNLADVDELELPPTYERPLILGLAIEIAPMFGIEPSMTLQKNHHSAITMLKRSNATPLLVQNDLPVGMHRERCY